MNEPNTSRPKQCHQIHLCSHALLSPDLFTKDLWKPIQHVLEVLFQWLLVLQLVVHNEPTVQGQGCLAHLYKLPAWKEKQIIAYVQACNIIT